MSDAPSKRATKKETEKILTEARERYEHVLEVDHDNKRDAADDTRFVYITGSQWPDKTRKARTDRDEPCLEFPQQKQFINQVVNDQRQNRPGIRVHPAAGQASEEVAEVIQGLCRGIEYDSQAEAAYDTGFQHAVVGGRGYWRVVSEYESPTSFNQKLVIKRIADPSMVDLDPDFQEPDGSDRNYGFVSEHVTKAEFESRWPDAKALDWEGGEERWYPSKDEVRVADYYRRVCTRATLLLLSDGSTAFLEDLPAGTALPPGVTVVKERDADRYTIEWYKIAGGQQILETNEWPGTIVPIICCMGDEIIVDGKRIYQGLIRQARDSQRMYNYRRSAEALRLTLAPKAPFMAAVEAITGYEPWWEKANRENLAYLPFHAFTPDGKPLPVPQRIAPAPMESGWAEAAQQDKQDMRSVIGMYENSLGLHGNETSGRAIMAREKQGDNSTFHFVDNLSRAIALTGRILAELIPHYYDAQRIVTIVGKDDTRSQVTVNEQPAAGALTPEQAVVKNDLTVGQYAVTVEAGPSYMTKRQETADKLAQLVQSYPPLMQLAGDVVVGSMDLPDADELADRLKIMLPPQVQQAMQAKEQGQDPAAAQAMAQVEQIKQQAQQALQGMQQQLQQVQAQLEDKSTAAQLAASARIEEAKIGAVADIEIAEIQGRVKAQIQAMTQPAMPAEGAAPAEDPQASVLQGLSALMQQFDAFTQAWNAPSQMQFEMDPSGNPIAVNDGRRRTELQFDPNGNPIGAVRSAMTQ